MFKPNSNYPLFDLHTNRQNLENGTSMVVTYPENLLPDLVVPSEFGDCVVRSSDLYDLFNQERIENLGIDGIRDFLSRLVPRSSAVADSISKLSDDEIINSVKSRHIQSYSELLSWSKYLMDTISGTIDSVINQQPPETDVKPDVTPGGSPSSEVVPNS